MNLDQFYQLSAALTGYNQAQLRGTGVGGTYYQVLSDLVPAAILNQLISAFHEAVDYPSKKSHKKHQKKKTKIQGEDHLDEQIRILIMSNAAIGPVARNIIKMWYCSMWYTLPVEWQSQYTTPTQTPGQYSTTDFVISNDAYIQGLAWDALKAHPMGAKQPGWADWAFPPKGEAQRINIKQLED